MIIWLRLFFFIPSAPLSVIEELKQQHADNRLTLYCASRNKKNIQADLTWGKNVDIFYIFCILKAALNCFQSHFQVTVNPCGHNPLTNVADDMSSFLFTLGEGRPPWCYLIDSAGLGRGKWLGNEQVTSCCLCCWHPSPSIFLVRNLLVNSDSLKMYWYCCVVSAVSPQQKKEKMLMELHMAN